MFRLVQISLFLTILSLPLYEIRWQYFSIPTTLLENLLVVTIALWVIWRVKDTKFNLRELLKPTQSLRNPLLWFVRLFVLAAIISVFVSPDKRTALGVLKAYIIEPLLLYLVIRDLIKKGLDYQKNIILPLVLSGLWVSLFGLWQWLTHSDSIAPLEIAQGRITSIYNNPNFLGLYLGPILGIIVSRIFSAREKFNFNFLFQISLFIYLSAIFLSHSNGAVLGTLGIFLVFILYNFYNRTEGLVRKIISYFSIALPTIVMTAFILLIVFISSFTPKYGLVYPRPSNDTKVIRLCLWEGTEHLLKSHLLFGAGLGGFPSTYTNYRTCDTEIFRYPHNIFLNFYTEMGLLGLIGFLGIVGVLLKTLFTGLAKKPSLSLGLISAFVYIFIHGMSDAPYFKNDLSVEFWILAALVIVLREKRKE